MSWEHLTRMVVQFDTNFMLEKQVQGVNDDPEMKDKDIINT